MRQRECGEDLAGSQRDCGRSILGVMDGSNEVTPVQSKKFLDFIEHPLTLTALFALGGLVGTLYYTPFYALCAACLLLGLHRSGFVSAHARSSRMHVFIYIGAIVILCVGGYFLYGLVDAAVERIQTDFAKKVAAYVRENPSNKTAPSATEEPPLPSAASSSTLAEKPSAIITKPHKAAPQPIKAPLEIVAFRSDYGISIANNGPLSVHILSLFIKFESPDGTKSMALGLNVAPGKISEQKIPEEGLPHLRTIRKLADTWEDHVKKARELYAACGMQWTFFSPSDVSLQQIKDNYTGQNQSLGYKDISGILYYRVQGLDKTEEQIVPVVESITVNNDTCPKL